MLLGKLATRGGHFADLYSISWHPSIFLVIRRHITDQERSDCTQELCKKVGLKGEVALVGGRGRFEIWNLQRWKKAHDDETATYQHVAGVIGL